MKNIVISSLIAMGLVLSGVVVASAQAPLSIPGYTPTRSGDLRAFMPETPDTGAEVDSSMRNSVENTNTNTSVETAGAGKFRNKAEFEFARKTQLEKCLSLTLETERKLCNDRVMRNFIIRAMGVSRPGSTQGGGGGGVDPSGRGVPSVRADQTKPFMRDDSAVRADDKMTADRADGERKVTKTGQNIEAFFKHKFSIYEAHYTRLVRVTGLLETWIKSVESRGDASATAQARVHLNTAIDNLSKAKTTLDTARQSWSNLMQTLSVTDVEGPAVREMFMPIVESLRSTAELLRSARDELKSSIIAMKGGLRTDASDDASPQTEPATN